MSINKLNKNMNVNLIYQKKILNDIKKKSYSKIFDYKKYSSILKKENISIINKNNQKKENSFNLHQIERNRNFKKNNLLFKNMHDIIHNQQLFTENKVGSSFSVSDSRYYRNILNEKDNYIINKKSDYAISEWNYFKKFLFDLSSYVFNLIPRSSNFLESNNTQSFDPKLASDLSSVQKNLEKLKDQVFKKEKIRRIDALIKEIVISPEELDKLKFAQKDLKDNDFNVLEEYAVLDRPRSEFGNFTSTFAPCCDEVNVPWKFLHKSELSINVADFSAELQKSFLKLKETSDLDSSFLSSLEGKIVFLDRFQLPKDDVQEALKIFKNETPDLGFQQLISNCMHIDMLDASWFGLIARYPEIKKREVQNNKTIYEIDQIDYDKYKVAITTIVNLKPFDLNNPHEIHKYGIRTALILVKYANPEIRYSYYVE